MGKSIDELRNTKKWKQSERNAEYCIRHHLPFEMFLCIVDHTYKELIWNERLSALGVFFV